ncbi:MAG: tetratricopeptide repeat protein [Deltaproteobacteria bacterium]|nr:tetratricopeptide repeat protein [Deltaproteobacteria bacterium]
MFIILLAISTLFPSQKSISDELTSGARLALSKNSSEKAATIYEAVRILDPGNIVALKELANIYQSTNRNDQALELLNTILSKHCGNNCTKGCYSASECTSFKIAKGRIVSSGNTDDTVPVSVSVPDLAKKTFNAGLKLKKKRQWKKARDLLNASLKLNPDLVGVYRHLGEVYDKLKDTKQADAFYLWYLKVRPSGPNAAKVRKKLSKEAKKSFGTLKLSSSYSCYVTIGSEMLTNARGRTIKTPVKKLNLPEGKYAVGFICNKQHVARRFWINIKAGKNSELQFKFGGISVKLNPWARIYIASKTGPRKNRFMDAGLFDIIGLPEGDYKLKLVAFNNRKKKIMDISIKSKKIITIKSW